MEAYLPILHSLSALGVRFAVIGTWALRAYFPAEMKDYQLHDCDLVLDPAGENILEAIRILDEKGWNVTSWDEPVHADVEGSLLSGRFYLRARKADRVLDLTYECAIPWEEMKSGIVLDGGLPLASVAQIVTLKRLKAGEKNIAVLALLQGLLP